MTRRTMLWSPILLGAKRAWNALASGLGVPWGAGRDLPAAAPGGDSGLALETPNHKIAIDEKTARLLSLRSTLAPGQEFIVSNEKMPVFVIQYLTAGKEVPADFLAPGARSQSSGSGQKDHGGIHGTRWTRPRGHGDDPD